MTDNPSHSRREILRTLAVTGAIGGITGLGAASSHGRAQPSMKHLPRRGGRIRVASTSSSTADTLDPAKGALSTDYARHRMIYSGLTQFDANLTPQLALAERIEDQERTIWTIKLRK